MCVCSQRIEPVVSIRLCENIQDICPLMRATPMQNVLLREVSVSDHPTDTVFVCTQLAEVGL